MGLNDEREKLRQAAEWLTSASPSSEHFLAAYDHVAFVYCHAAIEDNSPSGWALRDMAAEILRDHMGLELH